jgi:hypothetical protein
MIPKRNCVLERTETLPKLPHPHKQIHTGCAANCGTQNSRWSSLSLKNYLDLLQAVPKRERYAATTARTPFIFYAD